MRPWARVVHDTKKGHVEVEGCHGERLPGTAGNLSCFIGIGRGNGVIQRFMDGIQIRGDPGFRTDSTDATFLRETRGMPEAGGYVSCTTQM